MRPHVVEVDHLSVRLPMSGRLQPVLDDVTLAIDEGQAVGLVGESGSGKTMTTRAIARLLPDGADLTGHVRVLGREVWSLRGAALRRHRMEVATVFQDPRAHINPVRTVGDFMTEALRTLRGVDRRHAQRQAVNALAELAVDDPEYRLSQYPHELSGGLLQRVLIAAMLLTEPKLLLADEPSTALDVTTQAELVALLDLLRRQRGMAMLFISHDLDLAAAICDQTAVMYAGQIVEIQDSARLHADPRHPYTAALAAARPPMEEPPGQLPAIPGRPLSAFEAPNGCRFAPRCAFALDPCRSSDIRLKPHDGAVARCARTAELRGKLARQGATHG